MTTHKDRPHAANCRACLFPISGGGFTEAPCNCAEGTRWHGNGARPEDAIAIQGIATFFARLQAPCGRMTKFKERYVLTQHEGRVLRSEPVAEFDVYASPVTPAAQTVDVADICNAYESGVGHNGRPTANVNPYPAGSHEHEAYAIGACGGPAAQVAPCEWREDEDGVYDTSCGNRWEFTEGGVADNDMKFCPYCGGTVDEHQYNDMPEGE